MLLNISPYPLTRFHIILQQMPQNPRHFFAFENHIISGSFHYEGLAIGIEV